MDEYCCFNCDSAGGGTYRPHEGETIWYIGLAQGGQAHFACENCKILLFDCHPVHPTTPGSKEKAK